MVGNLGNNDDGEEVYGLTKNEISKRQGCETRVLVVLRGRKEKPPALSSGRVVSGRWKRRVAARDTKAERASGGERRGICLMYSMINDILPNPGQSLNGTETRTGKPAKAARSPDRPVAYRRGSRPIGGRMSGDSGSIPRGEDAMRRPKTDPAP